VLAVQFDNELNRYTSTTKSQMIWGRLPYLAPELETIQQFTEFELLAHSSRSASGRGVA
jgi:hypothetical protein